MSLEILREIPEDGGPAPAAISFRHTDRGVEVMLGPVLDEELKEFFAIEDDETFVVDTVTLHGLSSLSFISMRGEWVEVSGFSPFAKLYIVEYGGKKLLMDEKALEDIQKIEGAD